MRHGNKSNVTRYAKEVLPVQTYKRVISMEEEAILIDQTLATSGQIEQSLTEASRCAEMTDALEDLAIVATDIKEATPSDISLVEAVAQMAVAGSDVDPHIVIAPPVSAEVPLTTTDEHGNEVVLATETRHVLRIATESMEESAEKIFDEVLDTQDSVTEKLDKVFDVQAVVPDLKAGLNELQGVVASKTEGSKAAAEQITLLGGGAVLFTGKASSTEAIIAGLETMDNCASFIYGNVADALIANGERLVNSLEKYASDSNFEGLVKASLEMEVPEIPGAEDELITSGPAMIGGHKLTRTIYKIAEEADGLATLDRIRNSRIELAADVEAEAGEITIDTLSPEQMDKVLKFAESLLVKSEAFVSEKKAKLTEIGEKLSSISEKLAEKLESDLDVNELRAAMNLRLAYCGWFYNPIVVFHTKVFLTVRAVRALVVKSLDQYQ